MKAECDNVKSFDVREYNPLSDLNKYPLDQQVHLVNLWLKLKVIPKITRTEDRKALQNSLYDLKKSVHLAYNDSLHSALTSEEYCFECTRCEEETRVTNNFDVWTNLQDHHHFEETLIQNMELLKLICDDDNDKSILIPWRIKTNVPPEQERLKYHSFLYPEDMMSYLNNESEKLLPLLKRSGSNKFWCIICLVDLPAEQVADHVICPLHSGSILKCIEMKNEDTIRNYVDFWKTMPNELYMEQLFIHPLTSKSLCCTICNTRCSYEELAQHIQTESHEECVKYFLKRTHFWDNILPKATCKEEKSAPSSPAVKSKEQLASNSGQKNAVENKVFYNSVLGCSNDSRVQKGSSKVRKNNTQPVPYMQGLIYYPNNDMINLISMQKSIYPKYIPKMVNTNLPVMQLKDEKQLVFKCLICLMELPCKTKLQRKLGRHSMQFKHIKQAKNRIAVESWMNYLKLWFTTSAHSQVKEQIHFDPYSESSVHCIRCLQTILFDDVLKHIDSESHRKKVEDYEIQKENEKAYSDSEEDEASVSNVTDLSLPVEIPKEILKDHEVLRAVPEDDGTTSGVLSQLERRYRSNLKVLSEENGLIHCKSCNVEIKPDILAVRYHIDMVSHRNTSAIEKENYKLLCGGCNTIFKKVKSYYEHIQKKCRIGSNKTVLERFEHFECLTCQIAIWGDEKVLRNHSKATKKTKEVKLSQFLRCVLDNMDREIVELDRQSEMMLRNKHNVSMVLEALEKALIPLFPTCQAYDFGSRVTGLGNEYSDLDVFIDIGNMYTGTQNQDGGVQKKIVYKVAGKLSNFRNCFTGVFPVASARTPIVRVRHEPTQIDCDLSFRHGLSVENSAYVQTCIYHQPKLKPMLLFLKRWFRNCPLGDGLTTYALTMMGIFFFQEKGYLPSVVMLREAHEMGQVIDGWHTIKYNKKGFETIGQKFEPIEPDITVGSLVLAFFQFYMSYDFSTYVVCPLLGRSIKREAFLVENIAETLPPEMYAYIKKVQDSPESEKFRAGAPVCVQDPFDLAHNLTKAFQHLDTMKTLMKLSVDYVIGENSEQPKEATKLPKV